MLHVMLEYTRLVSECSACASCHVLSCPVLLSAVIINTTCSLCEVPILVEVPIRLDIEVKDISVPMLFCAFIISQNISQNTFLPPLVGSSCS